MIARFVSCWFALAAVCPVSVDAQDEAATERGQLLEVQVLTVHPSDIEAFETSVGKLVAAATAAGLERGFGWRTWSDVFEYTVVSFHDTFAEFDDPDAWMRQFSGTDQEATVQAALSDFERLNVLALSRDVIEAESEWSYTPETSLDLPDGAEIIEVWITPGKFEAFVEVTSRVMAFHEQVGYPYRITGYSTHFGDTSRMTFVAVYDDMSAYVGSNRIGALAAVNGLSVEWDEILTDYRKITDDVRRSFIDYEADLSYIGSEESISDAGGT